MPFTLTGDLDLYPLGDPGKEELEWLSSSLDSDLWVEMDLADPELIEPVPGRLKNKDNQFMPLEISADQDANHYNLQG